MQHSEWRDVVADGLESHDRPGALTVDMVPVSCLDHFQGDSAIRRTIPRGKTDGRFRPIAPCKTTYQGIETPGALS